MDTPLHELQAQARAAQESRKHWEAIELYTKILRSNADIGAKIAALHQRGVNYAQLDEPYHALEDYRIAEKRAYENDRMLDVGKINCDRAEVQRKRKKFDEAEEHLKAALEHLPQGSREHASALGFYGRLSLSNKDFAAALIQLEQAATAFDNLVPKAIDSADAHDIKARQMYNLWVLALACMLNRKWAAAIPHLRKVIELSHEMGGDKGDDKPMRRLARTMRLACAVRSYMLTKRIARRTKILL